MCNRWIFPKKENKLELISRIVQGLGKNIKQPDEMGWILGQNERREIGKIAEES